MAEGGSSTATNPFAITKAVDFTDEEILKTWVPLPGKLLDPRTAVPKMLLGGKGCGRTHLMRHLSASVRAVAHGQTSGGFEADGYIGVYLPSRGLNVGRFDGKGQSSEVWDAVFPYYLDLWLAQLMVTAVQTYLPVPATQEPEIAAECWGLLDAAAGPPPKDLADLVACLRRLQGEIDTAVNNAALTRVLAVTIRETRGRLVFGVPQALSARAATLRRMRFLYLIDEIETFSESQQRYVNTLVRDREDPSSFIVGVRSYAVRTYATFGAEEPNREGSEFEALDLDQTLRESKGKAYSNFCRRLVARRLEEAGLYPEGSAAKALDSLWFSYSADRLGSAETRYILRKYEPSQRPYLRILAPSSRTPVRQRGPLAFGLLMMSTGCSTA